MIVCKLPRAVPTCTPSYLVAMLSVRCSNPLRRRLELVSRLSSAAVAPRGRAVGRADWLARAPPCLVVGARDDFVVDLDGVRETAAFFGVEPVVLADAPHDLMLAPGWERTMAPLLDWLEGLGSSAESAA